VGARFSSVWVERSTGFVLVGLIKVSNGFSFFFANSDGFSLNWVDRHICAGSVEVWFSFQTIARFS
jgi:hypothetical protein